MKVNKTDIAWKQLFEKYDILNLIEKEGIFNITATQINEFREARLMTKFDHSVNLPTLFSENELSILPNSRGTYIIGKFKAYQKLKFIDKKPISKTIPDFIRTFDDFDITSESTALNIAYMSGMIDEVLQTGINEPNSMMTLSGRMSSGQLFYDIKVSNDEFYRFDVQNSQIEIDGSYENLNQIGIVEAKNKIPLDFHIRQLYYPYRFYNNLSTDKKIIPIFFTFADDIFSFHIYKFDNLYEYTSIKKIDQINFILNDSLDLNLEEVKAISKNSVMELETTNIPFPQANNFSRILDIMDYIETPKDKFELAEAYTFDVRQSDYYANCLVYLGLGEKKLDSKFVLSSLGLKVMRMHNNNQRNKIIIELILKKKIFKLAFDSFLKKNGEFDKNYINKILYENVPTINSYVTSNRRASTVKSWIEWIFSVIE